MIRLLLVDDHQVLLDGVRALLDEAGDMVVKGMAHDGMEALEFVRSNDVDVVLMDINMPAMDGLDACRAIKQCKPAVHVIAMSMYGEGQLVQAMLNNGASGYLNKNSGGTELIEAIRAVHAGGTWLSKQATNDLVRTMHNAPGSPHAVIDPPTARETEVLKLISMEFTSDEIATELNISVNTVESHRRTLLGKLGARNSAGLIRIAMERGLIDRSTEFR